MKTFEDGYFVPARFLKGVETFSKNAEKTDKAPLHVAYNVNDGYFQIMGASLVSVLENNAHRAVMFHIFTDGYSKENAQKMEQLADRYGCVIKLYTLHMEPFADFHVKVERFSRITYGRIVMPLILAAETDHFLYLDADTMVIRPSIIGTLREKLWGLFQNGCPMPSAVVTIFILIMAVTLMTES